MEELKNWFDEPFYRELAEHLHAQHTPFNRKSFIDEALQRLDPLSLKERMRLTTELTAKQLPSDFGQALEILKPIAPHYDGTFKSMYFPDFVGLYGRDHFELSLDALNYFTRYSSSEFAIREFFKIDFERTLDAMIKWARDDNHHVRRLASEGSRPRLPWSFQLRTLMDDPAPIKPILESLKADPELYVRKSVANHLNDISKDNPETMLDWVNAWDRDVIETAWIVKHASRSLLKQGHPRAFALFGFEADPKVETSDVALSKPHLNLGEKLSFSFNLTSDKKTPQKLAVDYIVHYVKKNGKTSSKVFKLKEFTLKPGQTEHISKSQTFENFSTRVHYSGQHKIEILVNGAVSASATFDLKA
jgi:3-methyladenine DNA glycosylase AlkC